MPVHNSDVARIFGEIADLLEIEGANEFRVRAYRDAAQTVTTLSSNIAGMVERGEDLTELPGIGEELAAKIHEIVNTGGLKQLEEIRRRTPPELVNMLDIPGMGPKRVQALYKKADIITIDELQEAAQAQRVRDIEGFGPKTEQSILEVLERERRKDARTLLNIADDFVGPLIEHLRAIEGVERVVAAGSYRRRKETVGDLDILATGTHRQRIIDRFVGYEDVGEIISQGETKSSVVLRTGLQVDLRVVSEESAGAALLYFTGSKAHNIHLRNMALEQDLKINEYGVFRDKERLLGETEEEIYGLLDLSYIEPELREDRGEIEAAQAHELPYLITLEDLRGDLQMHTTASDGHNTLREMAAAASDRGYDYIAITDHSPRVAVARGLDADALAKRIDEIQALDEELEELRILTGIEVDILEDGELDLPDDVLAKLDLVVFSVHSNFGLSADKQTERILRAMDNPYVHILAHPTGRKIDTREPYPLDLERLMRAALDRGCYFELNAYPNRLDLDDVQCRMAKEIGLKVAISTDAHRVSELRYLRYGVDQARRGWLEPEDVLNTRPWQELRELLDR